jgi:ACS family tartrate transporter-like MFS transporter
MIGFLGCAFVSSVPMMVLMLSITSAGLYGISGTFYAYITFFFSESTAPAGIALVSTLSSLGGFVGPMIMGIFTFTQAMFIIAGFLLISLITLTTLKLLPNNKSDLVEDSIIEVPN